MTPLVHRANRFARLHLLIQAEIEASNARKRLLIDAANYEAAALERSDEKRLLDFDDYLREEMRGNTLLR